jgi:cyanophycinase
MFKCCKFELNLIFFLLITLLIILNLNIYSQGYVCAIGGGSENYNDWSDAPYSWIVQKSDSGKIIIISDSDASNWLPTYFMSLGADTAYNKTIESIASANLHSTYDELISAKAIFIRGGDQWNYIRLWKGTKTDLAIQYIFNNGGVIAGTSAGAAVLGDVDFSAKNGSAYPDEALLNPFYSRMQFENNFLNLVPNVLFDTHFIERGRNGRLIAMLYNQHFNSGKDLIGAGIDDRTAICISPEGTSEVMGSGAVTIYYKDILTKYSNYDSGKYTVENLRSEILTSGWKYNFKNAEVDFIPFSAKDIDVTRPWQSAKTDITLTGNNNLTEQLSNLSAFLTENNSSKVLIITHPGFSSSISAITNYLDNNNYVFNILSISLANLDNAVEAEKINQATCFIFAGDSLNVLSYLNQQGNLLHESFYNSISRQTPIFFFGNSGKIVGFDYVGNTELEPYASYRGKMNLNEGLNIFSDLVFQPLIYDNSDYYENRTSAVLWGMMRNRKRIGIYLNGSDRIKVKSASFGNSISGNVQIPFLIVDARETTKIDSSTYHAIGSIGTRQVVAMNNLRISLTNNSQIKYLLDSGSFDNLTSIKSENINEKMKMDFDLLQNFPNPFNPSTTINWKISQEGKVLIILFDILGNEIEKIVDKFQKPGTYTINYKPNPNLASGIYFYRLSINNQSITKSMVLLK